tara:strand:- start:218 stop:763 length:546 start_codon:yes stop_codon:yes gene_type:complete
MADSNRKDADSTKDILASIRKTMLEESGKPLSDGDSGGKPASVSSSDTSVVEELRRLIDQYSDLPEDLVMAVTELELGTENSARERGDDPFIELEELSDNTTADGHRKSVVSDPSVPEPVKHFIEVMAADMGISTSRSEGELDGILALLFKIIAYRWLDQNLEPLVKKLLRAEIERLAKTL